MGGDIFLNVRKAVYEEKADALERSLPEIKLFKVFPKGPLLMEARTFYLLVLLIAHYLVVVFFYMVSDSMDREQEEMMRNNQQY
jgi:hypothetical protein